MSQKTYQRSKLLIQVNNVARFENLLSWIISLANANSILKLILGIKSLSVNRFSKFLLRKFILKIHQHISLMFPLKTHVQNIMNFLSESCNNHGRYV